MSLDAIQEFLGYDPETGAFTWIAKPKGPGYPFMVGDVAGCLRKSDGRRVICFAGTLYLASRLAWLFVHGVMPPDDVEVDHKDTDPGNDRIKNLRLASRRRNQLNTKAHRDAASPFKGVSWHGQRKRWTASFRGEYIGIFETQEAAARAYDAKAIAFDPAFARVNFPEEVAYVGSD